MYSARQSTRPAIEHGVAPDFAKSLIPTTTKEVAEKVNYIHKNRVIFVKKHLCSL